MEVYVKKYFAHLLAIGGLVVLLAGAALAQDEMSYRIRADIPFEFQAGATTLPAGWYIFDLNPDHFVAIEQHSTGHTVFLVGMPADAVNDDKPVLTFQRVGSEYHLEELQGADFGVEVERMTPATTLTTISGIGNGPTHGGQH